MQKKLSNELMNQLINQLIEHIKSTASVAWMLVSDLADAVSEGGQLLLQADVLGLRVDQLVLQVLDVRQVARLQHGHLLLVLHVLLLLLRF